MSLFKKFFEYREEVCELCQEFRSRQSHTLRFKDSQTKMVCCDCAEELPYELTRDLESTQLSYGDPDETVY